MRYLLILLFWAIPILAKAQGNLATFLKGVPLPPHPICGINPSFDGQPKNVPPPPFATCYTLALGYGAEASYPDPGIDALAKLIVSLSEAGGWEARFRPVSEPPLKCWPALPLGIGPPAPPGTPICTVTFVNDYLTKYNSQPIVKDFKRFERNIQQLKLSDSVTVQKLLQAVAVVRATGPSITFKDVADLIE